jgi:hypothetical protein
MNTNRKRLETYFDKMQANGWNLYGDFADFLEIHVEQLEDAFINKTDALENLGIKEALAFIIDFTIAVKGEKQ